jgi:L-malate glycosyltransferase
VSSSRRIVFVVSSLGIGGSERKTVLLANALAAADREIAVAYLSPPESLRPLVHPAIAVLNLGRRGKFSIGALRRLAAIVRERRITTLVAVNLYPALYAVLARRLCRDTRVRAVVSVNTTEFGTYKERLQMYLYRYILRRADMIIFGAERQRRLWQQRYRLDHWPDRTLGLYNGVDTTAFSRASVAPALPRELPGRVMLGTVGAFRVEKMQGDLVRAVHRLAARGIDVEAVIVGDGPQRQEIEGEIRRLGVEQKVRLVGETQDVRPYLASMDIFVLTSVAVETFSNAVLEAMAMSCPVVVSRVGGIDEMLQFGGGMLYPPGDVQSLCERLIPLIASPRAREDLGRQARQAVEKHFSFEKMLSNFRHRVLDDGAR